MPTANFLSLYFLSHCYLLKDILDVLAIFSPSLSKPVGRLSAHPKVCVYWTSFLIHLEIWASLEKVRLSHRSSKRKLHTHVHGSVIRNSKKQLKCLSRDGWIRKMQHERVRPGTLFSQEKGGNPAICSNMGGPWGHCTAECWLGVQDRQSFTSLGCICLAMRYWVSLRQPGR